MVQSLWNTVWQFLKKLKHRVTLWLCNSIPGHLLNRNENLCLHKHLHVTIHNSIIHNSQNIKQSTNAATGKCMNKMCPINTMEYHSAIRRNTALTHVSFHHFRTENTTLSERNQIQKITHCLTPCIWKV